MSALSSPEAIVALAAAGLALVALTVALSFGVQLRRIRRAQLVVLGSHEERDVVSHAERLEGTVGELRDLVEDSMARLEERLRVAEERLDGCLSYRAVLRYDAYGELSGRQSSSIALIDSRRSGVVLSSILHREHARVYVKQIHEGESELELLPEEREAMEAALGSAPASRR